jgi:hypothetical protein
MRLKILTIGVLATATVAASFLLLFYGKPSTVAKDPSCVGFDERAYAESYFRKHTVYPISPTDVFLGISCDSQPEFEGNDRVCVARYRRTDRNAEIQRLVYFSSKKCANSEPMSMYDEIPR